VSNAVSALSDRTAGLSDRVSDSRHLRTRGVRSGVGSSVRDGGGWEDVDRTDGGQDLEQVLAGTDHP
jgi:hypothetical protein